MTTLRDIGDLKKLTDYELAEFQSGWKQGSIYWILADHEFKRRKEMPATIRSWLAIAISVTALLVSIIKPLL